MILQVTALETDQRSTHLGPTHHDEKDRTTKVPKAGIWMGMVSFDLDKW